MLIRLAAAWAALTIGMSPAVCAAQDADSAYIRIVDVGAGLCVVASAPGGQDMLYDSGHHGHACLDAVIELVPDRTLELVVVSHSDSDHLTQLPAILRKVNRTERILWGAFFRDNDTYRHARDQIEIERAAGTQVLVPDSTGSLAQTRFQLGDARVTFVAGWPRWPHPNRRPGRMDDSELRNVVSIVVRYEYGGRSVLLTGDAIGRRRGASPTSCRDGEAWMVRNRAHLLDADIMTAPHHGGDNASSRCFIRAVSPGWVIFPAGHAFEHPRQSTVERYLAEDVPPERMFRTDRGDNSGSLEASFDSGSCPDTPGDDDVEIFLSPNEMTEPIVRYRTASREC